MIISEKFGDVNTPINFVFDTATGILSIYYDSVTCVKGDRNQIVDLDAFMTDIRKRVI